MGTHTGEENETGFASFYIRCDGALGCIRYGPPGMVEPGKWHRLAISVDCCAGKVTYFCDGKKAVELRDGEVVRGVKREGGHRVHRERYNRAKAQCRRRDRLTPPPCKAQRGREKKKKKKKKKKRKKKKKEERKKRKKEEKKRRKRRTTTDNNEVVELSDVVKEIQGVGEKDDGEEMKEKQRQESEVI